MLQRSELVAVLLVFLVLEGIGVHSIEPDVMLRSKDLDSLRVLRYVPWYVEGDRAARSVQCVQQADVLYLFLKASRLSAAGESPETCTPGAKSPAGNSDLKVHEFTDNVIRPGNIFR